MVKLDSIQKRLIEEIADLHSVPTGAYNFRSYQTRHPERERAHPRGSVRERHQRDGL